MADLSDRFAELMARMAKSDAELFRTIGEQNAGMRRMVKDLEAVDSPSAAVDAPLPLPVEGLLPSEQCALKALKGRFGTLATAQSWLEERIGKAPKKPTWAVIEQTCRQGAWPAAPSLKAAKPSAVSAAALDERLAAMEQRLEPRLQAIESLLRLIAEAVTRDR